MVEFILWTVAIALAAPAYLLFISFITWANAFKIIGWGFVLRITLVLEIILVVATAYKHIYGGI